MAFDFVKWYQEQNSDDVLFSYKGAITSGKITKFLEIIEKKIEELEETPKLRRKVYIVLVESLQNLFHHGEIVFNEIKELCDDDDYTENCKFGTIIFKKANIGYTIITANLIHNNKIKLLKDKLDQINTLSTDEIKALYKLILNNHEFSDRGGGGLGMIDMAKRIENKLNYYFYDFNSEFSFYSLSISVY